MLIGVDIGGTAVKIGAVDGMDFKLLTSIERPFDVAKSSADFLAGLVASCRELERQIGQTAQAVGVCAPGYGDPDTGALSDGGANVPVLRGYPLARRLSEGLGIPAKFENDGVAAALGEVRFGAGRPFRRMLMLTLGTGVGGCVLIDGQVMRGARGEPPEVGAIILEDGGPVFSSGRPGSLESFACAKGFLAAYRAAGGKEPLSDVQGLFAIASSDSAAATAINATARRIAQAIGALTNALALDGCVIGGGIAQAGDVLIANIAEHLPAFTWPLLRDGLSLVRAAHGANSGLIGAASLAAESIAARSPQEPTLSG
jgi:glucokinase